MPCLRLRPLAVVLTVAALLAPRTFAQPLDPAFNPGASADVFALAAQPDGKILLGGNFSSVAGTARARLARLNPDGSLDTAFNPGVNASVRAIVVQPDDRILVAGSFTTLAGTARSRLARLHADGSLDPTFNAAADNSVLTLARQPDGKILLGGMFTQVDDTPRAALARLNADGSLDTAFNPVLATDARFQLRIDAIVVLPNGKLLIGGTFATINGAARPALARLHADGSVDPTFALATGASQVNAIVVQPDDRLLVGGSFTTFGGVPRQRLARLSADGVPDNSVGLTGPNATVHALLLQPDGKFVVGGTFTEIGNSSRARLARFNPDGSLDPTFVHEVANANGASIVGVYALAAPSSTHVLVAGTFAIVSGQPRRSIARFGGFPPTIAVQPRGLAVASGQPASFSVASATPAVTYQWQHNGIAIPDATSATLTLPRSSASDAGTYAVVISNAFGSFTSDPATLVVDAGRTLFIIDQPNGRSVAVGDDVTFRVNAGGAPPLAYQWRKDGADLPGATASTLTLATVLPADAGSYSVVIRDTSGSLTSADAVLTVTGEIPFTVSTHAGRLGQSGTTDGDASSARLLGPDELAVDAAGFVYVSQRDSHVIRKIARDGSITTLAGSPSISGSIDGTGQAARFNTPAGIVVDRAGNVYVADTRNHRIRKITPAGTVTTLAGSTPGFLDGTGTAARFLQPEGLAIDADGNLYCTETGNHTVRKITPAGVVTLVAGLAQTRGFVDGAGTDARFAAPTGIAVDAAGNLFVADSANHVIRRIAADGTVSTYAGTPGSSGMQNGPAASARLSGPRRIALDPAGNLFVAASNLVRRISPDRIVSTSLGSSTAPDFLDGPGATARFSPITGLATDSLGTLYISDSTNALVRQATLLGRRGSRLGNLSVRTVAGTGDDTLIAGFNLAGGPKSLLVRAIGPTLATFGVDGALADPTLQLETNGATLAQNDNWHASTGNTSDALAAASASVGAFALPAQSRDAALLQSLPAGSYTAQVGGGNGIALVEVYDLGSEPKTQSPELKTESRLANVSARTRAATGDAALIVGFVVTGDSPRTILLRAIGPTLASFGVEGALANPRLELTRDTLTVATNTGWSGATPLAHAFTQVGAFPLPIDSRDAALLVTLLPGAYTAQVTPATGSPGIALVEIYDVPSP